MGPVLPGVTLAVVMAGIAIATELIVRLFVPSVSPLALLGTQAVVAVLAYVPFVVYSPFQELRAVVHETVEDFAPRFASWVPAPAAVPEVDLTKVG